MNLNQVTVPVTDVEASVAFYARLGLIQIVAAYPHYARFVCPTGAATFSLSRVDTVPVPGVVVYFECDDVDAMVARLTAAGVRVDSQPTDQPWLWREAALQDPDGNRLCLYRAGRNRLDPPWRLATAAADAAVARLTSPDADRIECSSR